MMIRKTRSQMSLTYQGGATCGLFATDFTAAESPVLAIGLDLTCNVRTRNKSENTYADAVAYSEGKYGELASIQINEAQVCEGLRKVDARHPGAEWRLVVHIDDRDHAYDAVTICDESYSVILRVRVVLRVVA
jgi:hypothetical protein